MMKLWNAYTDAAVAPVEAHLKQQGTKDLATVSNHIQEWLIHRSAAHQQLADLKSKVSETERRLNQGALSSEEAKRLWEEFQSYFYGKFMAFNQSLPGNMREGRAFIYSTEFAEPMSIANFISGRHESYREGLRLVRSLEEKVKSGAATGVDLEDLEDQKRYLEIQKKQIAAGLAVFLIRKYMYRDDVYRSIFDSNKPLVIKLDEIQHDLVEAFGFQYFMSEFIVQLKDVFQQYELIFQAADIQAHLELPGTTRGR
jgi:thermostable 8-oxoguanine DNA glycosylase